MILNRLVISAAAVAVMLAGAADARPGERLRKAMEGRASAADSQAPQAPAATTIAYGPAPLQQLSFWRAGSAASPAPLVIYVHGGGWQRGSRENAASRWLPTHLPAKGYAYAAIDYRLVPDATVEQQAGDIALALKALLDRAGELGIDRGRVVLMGHSAGAHLVALVGTDERYLRETGLSFANLRGVIPNDGAAYDVPAQMTDGPAMMQQTYRQAFGTDPARQRQLSPTFQAASPNAPSFLLLHVQRPDGVRQADALAAALRRAGTAVENAGFPGEGLRGHMEINRRLGDPGYAATATMDAWLARIFAR